jgi:hypothetical protein
MIKFRFSNKGTNYMACVYDRKNDNNIFLMYIVKPMYRPQVKVNAPEAARFAFPYRSMVERPYWFLYFRFPDGKIADLLFPWRHRLPWGYDKRMHKLAIRVDAYLDHNKKEHSKINRIKALRTVTGNDEGLALQKDWVEAAYQNEGRGDPK